MSDSARSDLGLSARTNRADHPLSSSFVRRRRNNAGCVSHEGRLLTQSSRQGRAISRCSRTWC
jgi:hypothetical protein